MPLGGLLIALFVGWALNRDVLLKEMDTNAGWFRIWQFLVRFVAPTAVAFVFLRTIPQIEGNLLPAVLAILMIGAFSIGQRLLARS